MTKKMQLRETLRIQKRGRVGGPRPGKYRLHTKCPQCDLVFLDGVWKRDRSPASGRGERRLCPACMQIRDGQTGGLVELDGSFADAHRGELLNRIRNVERRTRLERPLERIISLEEGAEGIRVSVTTEHLVARIGKAIQRDFGGTLTLRYAPQDKFAVVHWHRDA